MELMGDAERSSAARVTARRFFEADPQDRGALRQGNIALIHSAPTGDEGDPSFRGDAEASNPESRVSPVRNCAPEVWC
jgi:hypothetical protein